MDSLQDVVESTDNLAAQFRHNDTDWEPYVFPSEYTNWIEEQLAIRETCALIDQSYHMELLEIDGPDAIDFLSGLATNDLTKFRETEPPQAINLLLCNPDGYVIADVVLFQMGENYFESVGAEFANNWVRFNAERTELDVNTDLVYGPFMDADPSKFRFQLQGPEATETLKEIVDGELPDISFFGIKRLTVSGREVSVLGHGMAATPGYEVFGPYDFHDEFRELVLTAGEPRGIRQMGSMAYKTGKIGSGWFNVPVPAIYRNEQLHEYREWLGSDSGEAMMSIGGSYVSDDISDYYMTPMELGQKHLIDFNHDFVGKSALERKIGEPHRERVTLVWDQEDVIDVYASLFQPGNSFKYIHLPDTASRWSVSHYDLIKKDGEEVGLSKYPGYLYYEREMLSLATIDGAYSTPGTEVTFIWGDTSGKRGIERHEPKEISATVARAPYVRGGRRRM